MLQGGIRQPALQHGISVSLQRMIAEHPTPAIVKP
jgi:hypothetical protein